MPTSISSPSARLQELLPELMKSSQLTGEPYLRFQLLEDTVALLPMDQVIEALLVPAEQVTSLPNMPDSFIGLMSSRDTVFGVIDLPHVLGFPPVRYSPRQYQVIVVAIFNKDTTATSSSDEILLGLSVPIIQGITRLSGKIVDTLPKHVSADLHPYLWGSVKETDRQLPVLNIPAITSAPGFNQMAL